MAEINFTIQHSGQELQVSRAGFRARTTNDPVSPVDAANINSGTIDGLPGNTVQEKLAALWTELKNQKTTNTEQATKITALEQANVTAERETWLQVTTNKTALSNHVFLVHNDSSINPLQIILPSDAALGFSFTTLGITGTYQITQNAAQKIIFGNISTTEGVNGLILSADVGDCIRLSCIQPPNIWAAMLVIGNLSFI